jgi:hypothetical protein
MKFVKVVGAGVVLGLVGAWVCLRPSSAETQQVQERKVWQACLKLNGRWENDERLKVISERKLAIQLYVLFLQEVEALPALSYRDFVEHPEQWVHFDLREWQSMTPTQRQARKTALKQEFEALGEEQFTLLNPPACRSLPGYEVADFREPLDVR